MGKQSPTRESEIQAHIRGTMNHRDAPTRLWRNNVGCLETKDGRWVDFGLSVGSADLIGIERRLITDEMVGQTVGVFLAVEVKTAVGKLSKEQVAWLAAVRAFGGEAHVMRNVDDAVQYLRSLK